MISGLAMIPAGGKHRDDLEQSGSCIALHSR